MSLVTGDETGLVKIWDISRSSGPILRLTYGKQSREASIASMCWVNNNTIDLVVSSIDGNMKIINTRSGIMKIGKKLSFSAGLSNGLSVVQSKIICVSKSGAIGIGSEDLSSFEHFDCNGPVDAVHINHRFGLVATGGKDNDLCVYNLFSDSIADPIFSAKSIRDPVFDTPIPVYVTGISIVNPFIFCTCTAYHEVRFYDRRTSEKPIEEFKIDREIDRRPTTLMQWNVNKFLVGEASGDVHLYDTRRGFSSRAKLRGGVGSVRSMAMHPSGHKLLAVAGLDRKARIYHVPTGKLLSSVYAKQRINCVLFDKGLPFTDNLSSFSGVQNTKQPNKQQSIGDDIWDNMEPIVDDLDDINLESPSLKSRKRERE